MRVDWCVSSWFRIKNTHSLTRWVARIGVTPSREACFLTDDRQCTELPLLRLPRLVPEVVGCDPFVPRDLARVGWRGLAPFLLVIEKKIRHVRVCV